MSQAGGAVQTLSALAAPTVGDRTEEEFERWDEPACPVGLGMPTAWFFDETEPIAAITLAGQKVGELSGITEGIRPFVRPSVDIKMAWRCSIPLDVVQHRAVREPHLSLIHI